MPEDRQGTGKHPHKSTEEPYPHHESSQSKSESGSESQGKQSSAGDGSESRDLKEREYRDNQGEVHHHTKTYEEQHKGEKEDEAA